MILILKLIALTSLWVLGLKIATEENMVLEQVGKYGKAKAERYKIFEAVIVCEWCMPSVYSIFGYALAYTLGWIQLNDWRLIVRYPMVVAGSSIVCGFTWLLYETLSSIRERNKIESRYYQHVEKMAHWDVEDRKQKHKNYGSKIQKQDGSRNAGNAVR